MRDDAPDGHPLFARMPEGLEFAKLRKRIVREAREAIETYAMARRGDRWLVCLSGGGTATLLRVVVQWRGLLYVDLLACNLDQGSRASTRSSAFLKGVAHRIEYRDTYSIVTDKVLRADLYSPAPASAAAISTGWRARKDVRPSSSAITAMTRWRRSS